MKLSILICSYNPIDIFLSRCLSAIQQACLQLNASNEILLIDNNSNPPLHERQYVGEFLRLNPNSKIINESTQGLTPARLRAIKESTGELLIFIDDDNIVDENYFEEALKMSIKYPFIGAFSGNVVLDFSIPPPKWLSKYNGLLVESKVNNDLWTNNTQSRDIMPCGAGLCIKREVGQYYLKLHEGGKRKFTLDRNKDSLFSAGDNDIALCACDIGLGMGLLKSLTVRHLIPEERMEKKYIKKLLYGIYFSGEVLNYIRGKKIVKKTLKSRLKHLLILFTLSPFDASIFRLGEKARENAKNWAKTNLTNKNGI